MATTDLAQPEASSRPDRHKHSGELKKRSLQMGQDFPRGVMCGVRQSGQRIVIPAKRSASRDRSKLGPACFAIPCLQRTARAAPRTG